MNLTQKEMMDNYEIIGAFVLSGDYMVLLMQQTQEHPDYKEEDEKYPLIRFIFHNLSAPQEERWGANIFDKCWSRPRVIPTITDEFLVADAQGMVYYNGLGENKKFKDYVTEGDYWAYLNNLAYIDGQIYGCGLGRTLFIHKEKGPWIKNEEARKIEGYEEVDLPGFGDLDGFSKNEIYCVGGIQDVLLFNGKDWQVLDIADGRFRCECVHCGEDGLVYIGFMDGRVARGRGDQWEVTKAEDSVKKVIKTITTHKGRVFIGTEFNTYVLNDDLSFTPYDFDGELNFSGGDFVHSAHGCMIVATMYNQVAFHDGKQWLNIKDCDQLNPMEESDQMRALLDQAQDVIDDVVDYIKAQDLDEEQLKNLDLESMKRQDKK